MSPPPSWVLVVTGVGANQASNLASQYSYLVADNGHAGTLALLSGVFRHPVRAFHMLSHRAHAIIRPLITSGLAGVLSPIGLLVSVGTLVPAGLAMSPSFSSVNDSFQTLAVVPFVLVGDVMVLLWLGARLGRASTGAPGAEVTPARRRSGRTAIVWGLACLLALTAVVQDARLLVHLRQTWWTVSPSGAAALLTGLDQASPSMEVIASNGVIGRFSQRRYVYPLQLSPQTVPVKASKVLLVIATAGNEALSGTQVSGRSPIRPSRAPCRGGSPKEKVCPPSCGTRPRVGGVSRSPDGGCRLCAGAGQRRHNDHHREDLTAGWATGGGGPAQSVMATAASVAHTFGRVPMWVRGQLWGAP